MSNPSATEATPLLDREVPSAGVKSGFASRALVFRITTAVALVAGILTLIFLVVCMILFSGAPPTYYPPYNIYYSFAPVAGFVSAAAPPLAATRLNVVLG